MKTYLIKSDTNYGLMVHVVNADTQEEAVTLAKNHNKDNEVGAWDGCEVVEIDLWNRGVVHWA